MTPILTVHLGDLAESLAQLRRRFRQTARFEVARAVGEALHELALALICGPVRYRASTSPHAASWDDPWQDVAVDPWHTEVPLTEESERDNPPYSASRLRPALVVGLGAARWSFVRTRQLPLAVAIGLVASLAAYGGGPTIQALLNAWTTANDLLNYPDPDRRP
jgi:hypothetical protein